MREVYDNWERLVRATVRREELWRICHEHSRTPSDTSTTSGSGPSPGPNSPAAEAVREAPPTSSSARVSPLNHEDRQPGGAKFKKDKSLRRGKSRSIMRLDRWIWTRWLSNAFSSHPAN